MVLAGILVHHRTPLFVAQGNFTGIRNVSMEKLMLLWTLLTFVKVISLDIKMDPGMREGEPSYMYCDVGSVTAGVSFSIKPANLKGSCLGPGLPCSSPLYTISQNATGVLLEIATVNISREEGVWYCQHDADRSVNTVTANNYTIAGSLVRQTWTEPPGYVDTFSSVMTLSCTNKVPGFNFTFEDSQSNTGSVPSKAVSTTTQSSYDDTTCGNGNKFYVITLTASNKLDVFNNKTGVKFTFNYYGKCSVAPFGVNFLKFDAGVSDGLEVWVIAVIGVVVAVLVIVGVSVMIIWCWKEKKCCFENKEEKTSTEEIPANTTTNGKVNSGNGTEPPINLTPK